MPLTIDESRVEAFVGQVATDVGAALNTALVVLGDRLGLYRAMADAQPVSAADLAARTSTHERYVREWLNTQAASGYVTYDPESDRYTLPAEHAFVLADESSPLALAGMFHAAGAGFAARELVEERFRTGGGVGWHEHHDGLFCGTERAFAANYRAHLVHEWLPALAGVVAKLERGARVADVGCGHGAATILMAQAFPASTFDGFDIHEASIETARRRAGEAGVADRVRFSPAAAGEYPGEGYDGTALIVEPFANDRIEDNLNPVGRFYYGMSTLVCTPGALSQAGGASLGTQAGQARLTEALRAGGFTHVRRAAETPLNLILEARP
jgi:2-polyprenyl-3-methyl-5-hydroxy-6-metoxy-1,4-benzoquinol methylase